MFFNRRGRDEKRLEVPIDNDLERMLEYYTRSRKNLSVEEAVRELLRKGYNYWLLEKKYGDRVDSPLLWDRGLQCMRVESAFLYYRMRVREVIEELKNAILILSGVLADLESCYKTCKPEAVDLNRINEYRRELSRYMREYIRPLKEEAESDMGLDVDRVVRDVERLLAEYKSRAKG